MEDGSPDSTFGFNGGRSYPEVWIANGVAVETDGGIVATGFEFADGGGRLFATLKLQGGEVAEVADEPPQTEILAPADRDVVERRIELTFSDTDDFTAPAALTFECKRNRLRWRPCSSPHIYYVRPGRHRFAVRATDAFPQSDPDPAVVRVRAAPTR